MERFSVDDRGNVAQFYELYAGGEYEMVAELNREAGPNGSVDSVYSWDGGDDVTEWAKANGYADEIAAAERGEAPS